MTAISIEDIDADTAASVLWHYKQPGLEPVDYIVALMRAVEIVTHPMGAEQHRRRMTEAYPNFVAAFDLARTPGGFRALRDIAGR